MPGQLTNTALQLIFRDAEQEANREQRERVANEQNALTSTNALLKMGILPNKELLKAIPRSLQPGYGKLIEQYRPILQAERQQKEMQATQIRQAQAAIQQGTQAATTGAITPEGAVRGFDFPTIASILPPEFTRQMATQAEPRTPFFQQQTQAQQLASRERVISTSPTTAALAFGAPAVTAGTGRIAQRRLAAEFQAEAPTRKLNAQTAFLNAQVASTKLKQLPEQQRITIEKANLDLQQAITNRDTATIRQTIQASKAALAQETNELVREQITGLQSAAMHANDTITSTTTVSPSGVTIATKREPFTAEKERESIAQATFDNRNFRDLDADEKSVVNQLVRTQKVAIAAAGRPLDAQQSRSLGFLDVGIKMANDIATLFNPAFVGPVRGRAAALLQMADLTTSQENQLRQILSRAAKIAARADTGAQSSFQEMQDLLNDFAQAKNAPGVFKDRLIAATRQLVQRRDSQLAIVNLTRGDASKAKFAEPAFDLSLPTSPSPGAPPQDTVPAQTPTPSTAREFTPEETARFTTEVERILAANPSMERLQAQRQAAEILGFIGVQ